MPLQAGGPRPELEGEVAWTANTSLVYPVICLVCGMAAGLLGIGGGMVVGPLLLELKDGSCDRHLHLHWCCLQLLTVDQLSAIGESATDS